MNGFELSEIQAQAILDMRLQKLTGLEVEKVVQEYKEIIQLIAQLKNILESRSMRMDIIKTELKELLDKHGDERRTEIMPYGAEFSIEDMIADEGRLLKKLLPILRELKSKSGFAIS